MNIQCSNVHSFESLLPPEIVDRSCGAVGIEDMWKVLLLRVSLELCYITWAGEETEGTIIYKYKPELSLPWSVVCQQNVENIAILLSVKMTRFLIFKISGSTGSNTM